MLPGCPLQLFEQLSQTPPNSNQLAGGDLIVKNISCLGGHGISIGSVRHGTVSNTTFSNITLTSEPNSTQAIFSSGGECNSMFLSLSFLFPLVLLRAMWRH
jgi:hypothetical protein